VVSGFSNVDIANFPANFPDVDVKNLITTLNSKIDSLNGKIDAITGGTTPAVTTLSGRNVEEVRSFNAEAITDTTSHLSANVDLSKYKKIRMFALSTLDQPVQLTFYRGDQSTTYYYNGTSWVQPTITLDQPFIYDVNSYFNILNDWVDLSMQLSAKCATAPTSGSLTVYIEGVNN
jgi:hypothetical protein